MHDSSTSDFDSSNSCLRNVIFGVALGCTIAYIIFHVFSGGSPFGDEGSYCTIAQGILDGGKPYADFFNEKAPLQYYWTALVMWAAGSDISGARLASTLTLAATLSVILAMVQKQRLPLINAAVLALCASTVTMTGLGMRVYNNTAESSLALLFALSAVLVYSAPSLGAATRGFTVGLLQGFACGFRQTTIAGAGVLFVAPWHRGSRRFFALGFTIGIGTWVGFLWQQGILPDFLNAAIFFHADNPSSGSYFRAPGAADYPAIVTWLTLLAVTVFRLKRDDRLWAVLWALAAAIPFVLRMDEFRLWPSTVILFCLLIGTLRKDATQRSVTEFAAMSGGVFLAAALSVQKPMAAEAVLAVSDRVRSMTGHTARIWAGPYAPNIYCYAQRRPASNYYFVLPWLSKITVREQLLADLDRNRPALIVYLLNHWNIISQQFPEIESFIAAEYALAAEDSFARYLAPRSPAVPDQSTAQ